MSDYIKKKKEQQPKGKVPLQPWDPKKKTPWIKIPTWEKDKRPKPEYTTKKKEKPTEKPAKIDKELFWANRKKNAYRNKKVYPKIGKDY